MALFTEKGIYAGRTFLVVIMLFVKTCIMTADCTSLHKAASSMLDNDKTKLHWQEVPLHDRCNTEDLHSDQEKWATYTFFKKLIIDREIHWGKQLFFSY